LIKRANEVLSVYETKDTKNIFVQEKLNLDTHKENDYEEIIDKIKEINPLEISPMDALNFLYNLKAEANEKDSD